MFRCAWCRRTIKENQPLFAISTKFAKGVDYSDKEGDIIEVYLNDLQTTVPMIVTTADSEAKKQGQDGMFTVCSQRCGKNLKSTLKKEVNTFKAFSDLE